MSGRARRRSGRDEDESREREASAAPPPASAPDSLLALVRRGAGNASVSRMIARQVVLDAEQEGTPAVTPHEPGDVSADLHALGGSAGGLAGAFGGGKQAAPAPTQAPTQLAWSPENAQPAGGQQQKPQVPPDIDAWFREQPNTNSTIADWLLRGKDFGFLTFSGGAFYEQQVRDISLRRTRVTVVTTTGGARGNLAVDPDGRLGVIVILEGLVRGHARRWMADPAPDKKTAAEAGDLIRNLTDVGIADAHGGSSADLYQHFDWTGANGPAQVLQALGDLPAGNYRIGLPFQGQFFPPGRYLWTRQQAAMRAAGADGTPADITTPSMIKFNNALYTSTWNPAKPRRGGGVGGYDDRPTGRQHGGVAELGSATLRQGIANLATQGINITVVFADNNNHIHITRD